MGSGAVGRRADLHAVCYCVFLRSTAYAKHQAWGTRELRIIPLPVGTAGAFSKYLPVLSSGRKVVVVFLA